MATTMPLERRSRHLIQPRRNSGRPRLNWEHGKRTARLTFVCYLDGSRDNKKFVGFLYESWIEKGKEEEEENGDESLEPRVGIEAR